MPLRSVNPATGELVTEYAEASDDDVARALRAAAAAAGPWGLRRFAERAAPLLTAAALLRQRQDALARLMAVEMGKPLAQGFGEVEKCAWALEHYARHAGRYLAREDVVTEARQSYVSYEPLGVVLGIMPWNFPLWQVFRFAAPTLMAGNTIILKHASNVSGCALAIEGLLTEAGLPPAVFATLLVSSSRVAGLIASPEVKAVALTGSTPAGRSVAAAAGAALKKTVLELGGSDPYVILEDADLESAAETCATARLINAGQSCIAAKRFVVVDSVRERFSALLVERLGARRMGDPAEPGVDLGPLARRDLRDEVHRQVRATIEAGARLLLGGAPTEGPGAFYPATALAEVRPGMAAFDEEVFGPVAAIVGAHDEGEAVALANATPFGLGAAVFTRDVSRGERIAATRLRAGACFVNSLVRSDPRLPFGGIGESGYGRELGRHGIHEFVNVKTVWVG